MRLIKFLLTCIFLLFFTQFLLSQNHWESIVLAGNTWSYLPATSEPSASWNQLAFNDSGWQTGPGGFGYSDGDDATIINAVNSIYLRTKFMVTNLSLIEQLFLDVDYDDAFIAYLNGTEVARSSNVTDTPPVFNSTLTIDHEAQLYQGLLPERHILIPSQLIQGENILAVQIINNGTASSDMSGLVFLNANINSADTIYQTTPVWFYSPVSEGESNLPLLLINTSGQTINDYTKIAAQMSVINNTNGINSVTDNTFEYNGNIGIKTRGSSSQMFDKKNYSLETIYNSDSSFNFPLLGMPEENDWVLHGPYSDKSLMRNALAYYLGNLTGRWSPRTRFCELYIDNDYRGVYVLMEKIKRDKNRVDISKLNPDEVTGDDLTGGYIVKIDRPDEGAWISQYKGLNGVNDVVFSNVEPQYADMPVVQQNYIKNYITDFEDALNGSNFKDLANGYRAYIDVNSFIDFYLINELSRNVDGYRLSTFFYKDKDSNDGKIVMGPLWDFDLAFGDADYYSGGLTEGWIADGVDLWDGFPIPLWWSRLREDPNFEAQLKIRWTDLRSNKFSTSNLNNFIDSCSSLLNEAQQRNFEKFPILDTYVWPNNYIGGTYTNEINYLKNWVNDRLNWMDAEIDLLNSIEEPIARNTDSYHISSFPNPFSESATLQFDLDKNTTVAISVRNILGETIFNQASTCYAGINRISFNEDIFSSGSGLYYYEMYIDSKMIYSGKLIKK